MFQKFKKNSAYFLIALGLLYVVGRYFYKKPSVINGENAPTFTSMRLNGEPFDLSKMRGQYVLLDFWGSWCGPCLQEVPNLRNLHKKFHNKQFKDATNFEIVSFGVEKDRVRWVATVQQLQMESWIHISDFKYLESPVALLYGVRVIPTKILLNTEGVIIGVNLTTEEMDKLLTEKLL
jgi:thiol-disulfide isomerase/thioredoxin